MSSTWPLRFSENAHLLGQAAPEPTPYRTPFASVSGPATSPIWLVTVPKVQPLLPGVNEYTRPAAPYSDAPIDMRPVVGVAPFDPSNDAIVVGPVVEPRRD